MLDRLAEGVEERQGAEDDVALRRSRRSSREATSALRERLGWVSSAPFGLPVVPEV